ncbi:MAG: sugar phosphate isomerase/epimerase [Chloroflexi bacterium]|nr:sugar phosphate isomerase/epimerase [Chloroflexota bacterium]
MNLSFVLSTQPTQFAAVAFSPDLEPQLAHLASLGYAGAELAVREPAKLDARAVKQMLDQHHLRVPALGTGQAYVEEHLSFTDPDESIRARAIERVESHIALAHVIASLEEAKQSLTPPLTSPYQGEGEGGVNASSHNSLLAMTTPLVILGLIRGKEQSGVAREQAHAWMVDALRHVARAARSQDVRLVLEPINRYETNLINTAADALDVIEKVGADNLGILFDTFHANIEEPRIEVSLRVCGSRLFHVHIADSNRWFPGAGHIDFARVIATLREMKYAGWVSAEILPKPDVTRAAEQTMRTMKPLM